MTTNHIRIVLIMLVAASLIAVFGLGTASVSAQSPSPSATAAKTSAAAATTSTITPTVAAPSATATKVVTATTPAPTATKVVTSTAPTATATKVVTGTTPAPTATKVVTYTATPTKVVTSTATVTATKVITATPTRTKTPVPTVAVRSPRAGTISTLSTFFALQNMDSGTTATINATFYDVTGTAVSTVSKTASPYRHVIVDQRSSGGGLDCCSTFQGAVVVSSTTQLAAVVSQISPSALGQDTRFDMYNGVPSTAAATSVFMPQLLKNVTDSAQGKTYNSTIAIQNTSSTSTAHITLVYNELGPVAGLVFTHTNISIPPSTSAFIDQATDSFLNTEPVFFGSGQITSDQPVAVIVNFNAAGALLAYPGFTPADAGTQLYAPFLLKNFYDSTQNMTYGTGMMIMSTNGSANVTVTYSLSDGSTIVSNKVANPVINVDQRNDPDLAGKAVMVSSATISANKNIVALTNEVTNNDATRGIRSTTYRAMKSGAAQAYIPILYKGYLDGGQNITYGSGVAGQLLGNTTTTITIQYYLSTGEIRSSQVTVNPTVSRVFVFDARLDANLSDKTTAVMSAYLSSNNGQTFVTIANQVSNASDQGDTLGSYAGVGQ